ncbi:MAG TPA: ATP-binding protein [Patescibacteria group bacterium]|nr:ATP-binding protein [Patescibacteria group bacterium]
MDKLIELLNPIFADATVGEFTKDVDLSQVEPQYLELCSGIQIIIDVIREKIADLERLNSELLQESVERQAILDSIGEGVAVLNEHGIVLFLNPVGQQILGWSASEIEGKPWVTTVPLEYENGTEIDTSKRPFESFTYSQEADNLAQALYYRRKNKSRVPIQTTVSPVLSNGQNHGTIIVFRDVSKEWEIEKLKEEFLSIAAHQLRGPLATMRWTTETLLSTYASLLDPVVREKIEWVYHNNQDLIGLVNDILSITRLSKGTISEEAIPTNVRLLITKEIDDLSHQIKKKHMNIDLRTDQIISDGKFALDPNHFKQVLRNIIDNAIKYGFKDSTIQISATFDGSGITIVVSDQGMGIAPKEKTMVFHRFFRGSNVIHSGISGTGLGLYVVKQYIDLWKGSVNVESTLNKGTSVTIHLPIHPL